MAKSQKKITEAEAQVAEVHNAIQTGETSEVQNVVEVQERDGNGRLKEVRMSMEELEKKGLKSKSAVIRYLDGEGYNRSAIANFLGIRYQHVRNVLVTPLKRTSAESKS